MDIPTSILHALLPFPFLPAPYGDLLPGKKQEGCYCIVPACPSVLLLVYCTHSVPITLTTACAYLCMEEGWLIPHCIDGWD